MVKVKAKMNQRILRQLSDTQLKALNMTAEAVKTEINNAGVVPKQTGELERSGYVDDSKLKQGVASVVYDTPYARRLYWHPEYNFRTDKNRSARGEWMDAWIDGSKKTFAPKTFRTLFRQLNRGVIK